MTPQERLHACLNFGNPDRILYFSMRAPIPTVKRWEAEGLPKNANLAEYFALDSMLTPFWLIGIKHGPLPNSGPTIIEETDEYVIQKDVLGSTVKMHRERQDYGGVHYLDFPVADRETFEKVKPYYDPLAPGRYPQDWDQKVEQWKNRDYPLILSIPGPFAFIRGLMGMEGLCIATYEQPALIEEMVAFLTDFITQTIEKVLREVSVDVLLFGGEDMAYKNGSMISPDSVRRFLFASYRTITDYALKGGARQIMLDSDGNVDELIPIWLDAGISSVTPFEAAAGMDPVKTRKLYPKLGMMGGIDKRVLPRGKAAIEKEVMAKVPPLLETGGFIPCVDHLLSPDIPLEGFRYYNELVRKIAEG